MCLNQITDSVTGNPPVSKPRESPLFVVFANRLSVRPLLRKPGNVRSPSPVAVGSRGSRGTTAARVAAGGNGGIAAARTNTPIARRPRQLRHGRCRPRHRNRNRTQRVAKPRRPTAIRYLSQNGPRTRAHPLGNRHLGALKTKPAISCGRFCNFVSLAQIASLSCPKSSVRSLTDRSREIYCRWTNHKIDELGAQPP